MLPKSEARASGPSRRSKHGASLRQVSHAWREARSPRRQRAKLLEQCTRGICVPLFASKPPTADEFFQQVEIVLTQHLGFHHAADQFLDGALAESVDDLAHGPCCDAARGFDCLIDISAPIRNVLEIAFVLQTS